jgi:hypothetical protein
VRLLTPFLLLTACATATPPAPAAAPVVPPGCVRALVLQPDRSVEELRGPDQQTCEQRLEALIDAQQEARAEAMQWLEEEGERAAERLTLAEQAVKEFRTDHGILLSVSLDDRIEMLDKDLASGRKLSRLEREERVELRRLAVEEQHLSAEIQREQDQLAAIDQKRAELLLTPPAQLLEPCAVCRD